MSLLSLILTLLAIGVLLYVINNYIPIDEKIKKIINIVVIVVVVFWILNLTGIFGNLSNFKIGK